MLDKVFRATYGNSDAGRWLPCACDPGNSQSLRRRRLCVAPTCCQPISKASAHCSPRTCGLTPYSHTNWLRNHAAASEQTVLLLIPQRCSATACDRKIRIPPSAPVAAKSSEIEFKIRTTVRWLLRVETNSETNSARQHATNTLTRPAPLVALVVLAADAAGARRRQPRAALAS